MNPLDAAEQLRALASRVRRNLPLNGDPERFHVEMSEIARSLLDLADGFDPASQRRGRAETPAVQASKLPRKGRVIVTTSTALIAGRRVAVQHRRLPFAIHVGD